MPDLRGLLEAEATRCEPDGQPAFDVLVGRRRARDRRARAAAAAGAVGVAVIAVLLVPRVVSGGDDRLPTVAGPDPTARAAAARRCEAAAAEYDGQVVAAYPTTVQAVRDYVADTTDATGSSGSPDGPATGPLSAPGWAGKNPGDSAAACYVDGSFPAPARPGTVPPERGLVMAADGAEPFLAASGPKESLDPAPLPPGTSTTDR